MLGGLCKSNTWLGSLINYILGGRRFPGHPDFFYYFYSFQVLGYEIEGTCQNKSYRLYKKYLGSLLDTEQYDQLKEALDKRLYCEGDADITRISTLREFMVD